MGIRIGSDSVRRDWSKIATDAAEATLQAFVIGPKRIWNAIPALLRALRGLRGEDTVEARTSKLVFETLGYAVTGTIATKQLTRRPEKPEAGVIISNMMMRAENISFQKETVFENVHLNHPASFSLFNDASSAIFFELRLCDPAENEANIRARFQALITEGLNRIRTRDPDYFSPVIAALSGADSRADARARAWEAYRALLIKRFEDEPLFGEDPQKGVTLGQIYQPLRAWWDKPDDDAGTNFGSGPISATDQHSTPSSIAPARQNAR